MKEPIIIPFLFLLVFLCAAAVFATLDMMTVWGYSSTPFTMAFAAQRFLQSLLESIIPAVITAIICVGLRMVKKPFSRFLGLVLCLGASYIVMVNGMLWLRGVAKETRPVQQTAVRYIQPLEIKRMDGTLVMANDVSVGGAAGVLVLTESLPAGRRLSVHPGAVVADSGGILSLRLSGPDPAVLTEKAIPAVEQVFTPDPMTSLLLRDIRTLTSDFKNLLADNLGDFFIASFALLFLCTASMAILRVTRWPLINIILLAAVLRGIALFYHLLSTTLRPEVAKAISDPTVVRLFPSIALAVLGVIFLLIDILFIPPDRSTQVEAL